MLSNYFIQKFEVRLPTFKFEDDLHKHPIENGYLFYFSYICGFQHKATHIGNGHEILYYVEMGYRKWASLSNLFVKQGDDRTVTPEYIAKPPPAKSMRNCFFNNKNRERKKT